MSDKDFSSRIFSFSRTHGLGAREQPVGANSVFQHTELMVEIVLMLFPVLLEDSI